MTVARLVMHLHHFLFRDARTAYQPHVAFKDRGQDTPGPIFEMCNPKLSRGWKALTSLAALLKPGHPEYSGLTRQTVAPGKEGLTPGAP